jgi:hypothetical protein
MAASGAPHCTILTSNCPPPEKEKAAHNYLPGHGTTNIINVREAFGDGTQCAGIVVVRRIKSVLPLVNRDPQTVHNLYGHRIFKCRRVT